MISRSRRIFMESKGVNFINVLRDTFSYTSLFGSFSLVMFGFEQNFVQKRARKTLMKLTEDDLPMKSFLK
jgi:hypothetical protein